MSLHHPRNFQEESRCYCLQRPPCLLSSHLRFLPERDAAPDSNKGVSEQGCPWIVDTSSGAPWPSSGVEQVQRQSAPPAGKAGGQNRVRRAWEHRALPRPLALSQALLGGVALGTISSWIILLPELHKHPEGSPFLQGSVADACSSHTWYRQCLG